MNLSESLRREARAQQPAAQGIHGRADTHSPPHATESSRVFLRTEQHCTLVSIFRTSPRSCICMSVRSVAFVFSHRAARFEQVPIGLRPSCTGGREYASDLVLRNPCIQSSWAFDVLLEVERVVDAHLEPGVDRPFLAFRDAKLQSNRCAAGTRALGAQAVELETGARTSGRGREVR